MTGMSIRKTLLLLAGGGLMAVAAPALADVKRGVDAWAQGDYAAAVREWQGPAAQGDPDAQFNMAQAYRLGRGVEANAKQAEVFYAKAAAQGHIKAADNYGLLLFQDGRQAEAMPYITAAAERGDPRAQYLLGIAHFNGDMVEKDWVRAYALLTLANSAELPQAAPALQQMDTFIPLTQRQEAQVLAGQIKQESDVRRGQQLAAVDLAMGREASDAAPPPPVIAPRGASQIPRRIASVGVAPSVAAAQAAVAEAERVTGTESPESAGADFIPRGSAPVTVLATLPRVAGAASAPSRPAPAPAVVPAPAAARSATGGPWKVQLGAFGVKGNAERLWSRLSANPAIAGRERLLVPAGNVTKLLAGGFASQGEAQSACNSLKRSGQDCLVTR